MRDMHEQIEQLSMASANQQEELETLLKSLEDQQNLLASTPAIRPVSRNVNSWITSRFGYRKSPFTGRREFHKGYDIASRQGTPILATADGVVTFAGKKGLYGNFIVIDHGHGMITRYGHCQKVLKKRGDKVADAPGDGRNRAGIAREARREGKLSQISRRRTERARVAKESGLVLYPQDETDGGTSVRDPIRRPDL